MNTLLLGLALSLGAPALKHPPIVGIWVVESVQTTGKASPHAGPLRYGFSDDGTWRRYCADKQYGKDHSFTLDMSQSPASIDLISIDAEKQKEVRLGIVKIDGDTMTLCLNDESRPTEFTAGASTHNMLYILKRLKPKE